MPSTHADKYAALTELLINQKLVMGDVDTAEAIAKRAKVQKVAAGKAIIIQGGFDDTIYFILSGSFSVVIDDREVAQLTANDHVGEVAIILPSLPRSATVVALEPSSVAKLSSAHFVEVANLYPIIWHELAKIFADHIYRRNALTRRPDTTNRVLIISPPEALNIAEATEKHLTSPFLSCKIWAKGVFRASPYAIESLEQQLDETDFAIIITTPDDTVVANTRSHDDIIFELGFAVGRLGQHRTLLLDFNKTGDMRLPDTSGLITIPCRAAEGQNLTARLEKVCTYLKKVFAETTSRW
ncbi:MAG: TIR domain-containing protein [Pseudomonadota bacterium]